MHTALTALLLASCAEKSPEPQHEVVSATSTTEERQANTGEPEDPLYGDRSKKVETTDLDTILDWVEKYADQAVKACKKPVWKRTSENVTACNSYIQFEDTTTANIVVGQRKMFSETSSEPLSRSTVVIVPVQGIACTTELRKTKSEAKWLTIHCGQSDEQLYEWHKDHSGLTTEKPKPFPRAANFAESWFATH